MTSSPNSSLASEGLSLKISSADLGRRLAAVSAAPEAGGGQRSERAEAGTRRRASQPQGKSKRGRADKDKGRDTATATGCSTRARRRWPGPMKRDETGAPNALVVTKLLKELIAVALAVPLDEVLQLCQRGRALGIWERRGFASARC